MQLLFPCFSSLGSDCRFNSPHLRCTFQAAEGFHCTTGVFSSFFPLSTATRVFEAPRSSCAKGPVHDTCLLFLRPSCEQAAPCPVRPWAAFRKTAMLSSTGLQHMLNINLLGLTASNTPLSQGPCTPIQCLRYTLTQANMVLNGSYISPVQYLCYCRRLGLSTMVCTGGSGVPSHRGSPVPDTQPCCGQTQWNVKDSSAVPT